MDTEHRQGVRIEAILDARFGSTAEDVIRGIVRHLSTLGLTRDSDQLLADVLARQEKSPTGMKGNIAIPHCRSHAIVEPVLVVARLKETANFDGPDGESDVVFFIAVPAGGNKTHMKVLSKLARAVVRTNLVEDIRAARSEDQVTHSVHTILTAPSRNKSASQESAKDETPGAVKIIAVTACPTGVAHTYMAADALLAAAGSITNVALAVETQGVARNTTLTAQQIAEASVVVFASSVGIKNRERFAHLPVVEVPVHRAVNNPRAVLDEALEVAKGQQSPRQKTSVLSRTGTGIMAGVSALIGILMIAGFILSASLVADKANVQPLVAELSAATDGQHQRLLFMEQITSSITTASGVWTSVYGFAIGLMAVSLVMFSSAIARSIGGQSAIVVGVATGSLAVVLSTGWVGALAAGLLSGWSMAAASKLKPPKTLSPLAPIVGIPLLTLALLALIALFAPILQLVFSAFLELSHTVSLAWLVIASLFLGAAMNSDFGGRINKIAYAIAVIGLTTYTHTGFVVMAAVIVAGMTAPLGLALASIIAPKRFSAEDKKVAHASWVKGLSFITESVLPFLNGKKNSMRLPMMIGGSVSAALSTALQAGSFVPHGGILAVVAMQNPWGWLAALATGTVITAVGVVAASPHKT